MSTRSLRTAASGMYAQQINIETIANNIANLNTTGFKKNRAEFKDMMYQEVNVSTQSTNAPGTVERANLKIQIGNGVIPSSAQKIFTQGDIIQTGNTLDVAIRGEGFFQIKKADGTFAYTRDGSFKISGDGTITTANGFVLDPGIKITDDILELRINVDGTVEAVEPNGKGTVIGNIELARFINPAGLKSIGDNLYIETEASGQPIIGRPSEAGFGDLHQGFLETSNVDIVEEMISMISAQRAYEINSKTVKTVEDMMTMANNLRR